MLSFYFICDLRGLAQIIYRRHTPGIPESYLYLKPCPHHTSPERKPRRYLLTFDVYGPCDLWRAGVDGLANLISQSLAILKNYLVGSLKSLDDNVEGIVHR